MPPVSTSPVPPGNDWIARELASLRRELAELRTARSGNAMQINGKPGIVVTDGGGIDIEDGGDVTCKGGGLVTVYDSAGNIIVVFGTGPFGNTGLQVQRPDGTPSFWAITAGGGFAAMFDRAGNFVMTDDATSGQGVARPYIPIGAFADNTPPTASTTSGSFTTLQTLVGYKQHPKITMQLLVYAQSAGQVRVVDQDGNQIGATANFTAGQFEYVTVQGALAGPHMQAISLNVQAKTTVGTLPIGVRGVAAWGVESAAF